MFAIRQIFKHENVKYVRTFAFLGSHHVRFGTEDLLQNEVKTKDCRFVTQVRFNLTERRKLSTRVGNERTKTLYEVLGVAPNASQKQIKEAFYKLSKQHHPDRRTSPESEEIFKKANEAYSVLSDETERQTYDNQLRMDESPLGKQQYQRRQTYHTHQKSRYKDDDFGARPGEGRILVTKKDPIAPKDLHKYGYNYEMWSIGHYGKDTMPYPNMHTMKEGGDEAQKRRTANARAMERLNNPGRNSSQSNSDSNAPNSSHPGGIEVLLSFFVIVGCLGFLFGNKFK